MSSLMLTTPRTGLFRMNALNFSTAADLFFGFTLSLGTRSAIASPRLVIVNRLPPFTCRTEYAAPAKLAPERARVAHQPQQLPVEQQIVPARVRQFRAQPRGLAG